MSKHTPGPWVTIKHKPNGPVTVIDANDEYIATSAAPENARLISAAPDLLAALEKARIWVAVYENMPGHDAAARSMLAVINAAIRKAKGE